jgi:hypothetical protein
MPKRQYHVRNWCKYNNALVNLGSITFSFSEKNIGKWHESNISCERGRPVVYSDMAIRC